jgi:cell division control protein 6
MRDLTTHGRLALLTVISKAAKREMPCRTRELYEEYATLCESSGIDTLSQRSVHSYLSDLRMLGILSAEENRSGSRGNYYSYELGVPFESAIEAMEDVSRLDAETNAIREDIENYCSAVSGDVPSRAIVSILISLFVNILPIFSV